MSKRREVYCPFCRSDKELGKNGFFYDQHGKHQRYECRNCHRTTTKPRTEKHRK